MIIVLLFVSFKFQNFLNSIKIFSGDYTDFYPDWFRNIGGTLSLTVFLNIVTPNFTKILKALIDFLAQWYDRGF
jgi:hypothetical protein